MQLNTEKNDGCILFVVHGFGERRWASAKILAKSAKAETFLTSHCINTVRWVELHSITMSDDFNVQLS